MEFRNSGTSTALSARRNGRARPDGEKWSRPVKLESFLTLKHRRVGVRFTAACSRPR